MTKPQTTPIEDLAEKIADVIAGDDTNVPRDWTKWADVKTLLVAFAEAINRGAVS